MVFPALIAALLVSQGKQDTLDMLEKRLADVKLAATSVPFEIILETNSAILGLVDQDGLKTPEEFRRAAALINDNSRFNDARVRHELVLTAIALGSPDAEKQVPASWDSLMVSTGREMRIGFFTPPMDTGPGEKYHLNPAPKSVLVVIKDPDEARRRAKGKPDDREVKRIVDEDQKAREGDWSKLTPDQIMRVMRDDRQRMSKIKDMLRGGRLITANDFANAALVLQHGAVWEDYAMAHELSLASLLLGNRDACWLLAASYDRMLDSAGYPQRFGTQYEILAGHLILKRTDPSGINDRMRQALHCPTLAEARERKLGG